MKFVKLALIAVIISCPYKSVHASDTTGTSQSTPADSAQTLGSGQGSTPADQTTSSETTTGQAEPTTQATGGSAPATGTTPAAQTAEKTEDTGETIDIKSGQGTDKIDYSCVGKYKAYKAKAGHTISKIVGKNGLEIWKAQPSDHAIMVVLMGKGSKKKHVAILLKSHKLVLFYRDGKSNPWKNLTSERKDVSKLKFYADGDRELTTSDYKVTIVGRDKTFAFTYEFNSGVTCLKIKHSGSEIWKSSDDPEFKDIKKFSLGLLSNCFHVYKSATEYKRLGSDSNTATSKKK
ncbi:hypothetical protein TpMuguga_03g00368 [Theileria parva strain Muguga]|uniref:Uncharacterized protein n=1 Tax=Theileria parva TaxID=5875 RepID=Q4MZY6_THEPA|nr:uncharacterized protein TpMuguga_03g00368 [Theileria parva strain Muguga]EAN31105.1 hypothetical protein TpMuguga_03g00368 [Theileria parva strain Muguga]|eukprot:XP_763388.1 hypothetical protein [Theileria parva strain Muguga]